jgi:lysylphosphatidylglycerol synthetase-like protein (DUF2156 family)
MSKHILLVDDDALLRRSLAFNLEQAGYIVNTAASAEDALAMARRDPIGPPHDQLASIEDFKAFCQQNDWLPAFYQTLPETLESYKQAGFDTLRIGDEGIVDLETFTLEGKAGKALRNPVNKLTNGGYKFIVYSHPPDCCSKNCAFSDGG